MFLVMIIILMYVKFLEDLCDINDDVDADNDDNDIPVCTDERFKELSHDLLTLHDALLNYEMNMKDKVIQVELPPAPPQ
eukprot:UN02381